MVQERIRSTFQEIVKAALKREEELIGHIEAIGEDQLNALKNDEQSLRQELEDVECFLGKVLGEASMSDISLLSLANTTLAHNNNDLTALGKEPPCAAQVVELFFDASEHGGSTLSERVARLGSCGSMGEVQASKCRVMVPQGNTMVLGEENVVTLVLIDRRGERVPRGGIPVTAILEPLGCVSAKATVQDHANGTYSIRITTQLMGIVGTGKSSGSRLRLRVKVAGEEVNEGILLETMNKILLAFEPASVWGGGITVEGAGDHRARVTSQGFSDVMCRPTLTISSSDAIYWKILNKKGIFSTATIYGIVSTPTPVRGDIGLYAGQAKTLYGFHPCGVKYIQGAGASDSVKFNQMGDVVVFKFEQRAKRLSIRVSRQGCVTGASVIEGVGTGQIQTDWYAVMQLNGVGTEIELLPIYPEDQY